MNALACTVLAFPEFSKLIGISLLMTFAVGGALGFAIRGKVQ